MKTSPVNPISSKTHNRMTVIRNRVLYKNGWSLDLFSTQLSRKNSYNTESDSLKYVKPKKENK